MKMLVWGKWRRKVDGDNVGRAELGKGLCMTETWFYKAKSQLCSNPFQSFSASFSPLTSLSLSRRICLRSGFLFFFSCRPKLRVGLRYKEREKKSWSFFFLPPDVYYRGMGWVVLARFLCQMIIPGPLRRL